MINYHDLKILHLFAVSVFFLSMTITLFNTDKKLHKIMTGLSSVVVLITGVILLDRFGISHSGPYPTWVLIKVGIWLALNIITPVVVKRFPKFSKILYWPWLFVLFVGIAMAIYKPL